MTAELGQSGTQCCSLISVCGQFMAIHRDDILCGLFLCYFQGNGSMLKKKKKEGKGKEEEEEEEQEKKEAFESHIPCSSCLLCSRKPA